MHIAPYQLKRAYHSTLSHLRRLAKPYGLTPARYDLLHLLVNQFKRQAAIHKVLGVTRATTSRMLISLEKLGFVKRSRAYRKHGHMDRRGLIVGLTDDGRRRMRAISHSILTPWCQLAFEAYFLAHGWLLEGAFFAVDQLITTLEGMAKHFGDTSQHVYCSEEPGARLDPDLVDDCVWDPDDFPDEEPFVLVQA